jgi:hypothetical protein
MNEKCKVLVIGLMVGLIRPLAGIRNPHQALLGKRKWV